MKKTKDPHDIQDQESCLVNPLRGVITTTQGAAQNPWSEYEKDRCQKEAAIRNKASITDRTNGKKKVQIVSVTK